MVYGDETKDKEKYIRLVTGASGCGSLDIIMHAVDLFGLSVLHGSKLLELGEKNRQIEAGPLLPRLFAKSGDQEETKEHWRNLLVAGTSLSN